MYAEIIKPNIPFATRYKLKRTPVSEEYRERCRFIDTHDFTYTINESGEPEFIATPKERP